MVTYVNMQNHFTIPEHKNQTLRACPGTTKPTLGIFHPGSRGWVRLFRFFLLRPQRVHDADHGHAYVREYGEPQVAVADGGQHEDHCLDEQRERDVLLDELHRLFREPDHVRQSGEVVR